MRHHRGRAGSFALAVLTSAAGDAGRAAATSSATTRPSCGSRTSAKPDRNGRALVAVGRAGFNVGTDELPKIIPLLEKSLLPSAPPGAS
jgi:hypothetical protein